MKPHSSKFDKLNQLIQVSLNASNDPIAKALEIARASGAFKQSNVIFFKNQLYPPQSTKPSAVLAAIKDAKVAESRIMHAEFFIVYGT